MSAGNESMGLEDLLPRARPRRADVQQIFDTLSREEKPLLRQMTNTAGMKLVLIPAGKFQMGSTADDPAARINEQPPHEVLITQPIYLGVTPVTQEQYQKVMRENPSRFHLKAGGGPDFPVERVSYLDALSFCKRLANLPEELDAKRLYRLPTEAEWEYACRAGGTNVFAYGDSLSAAQANFDGHFPIGDTEPGRDLGRTSKVGAYPPNNFGLYDMHGNVWEWCSDWYGGSYYAQSPSRDPQGPADGKHRVARGGCWRSHAASCRSAYRNALAPHNKDPYTGFRVVAYLGK